MIVNGDRTLILKINVYLLKALKLIVAHSQRYIAYLLYFDKKLAFIAIRFIILIQTTFNYFTNLNGLYLCFKEELKPIQLYHSKQ